MLTKEEIIHTLILFYSNPQDEELKKNPEFNSAKEEFQNKIEYFVNKKLGIDAIYTSLSNAANSFVMFRAFVNCVEDLPINEREKLYISMNEPFINSLMISLSKLEELLTNKKRIIVKDESVNNEFHYLDRLSNRLIDSNIRTLRNGWFAHPFEDKDKGVVYKPNKLEGDIFSVLRAICHEEHTAEFDKSSDRLLWFCEKYLMKNSSSSDEAILNIKSEPMEIIKNLNAFSVVIKNKKLYGIEPFFLVPKKEIELFKNSQKAYLSNFPKDKFQA
ncbi:hypothetical protein [Aeromonas hydrophila]|uniref:hypothetical protein n=1 Tax=Aeromonas hydrophila TaxID=644 RepID=UPI001650AEFA|nr:hypothetical protein [Aeromonas hydrophila]MBC6488027.1 hypothetical protein [Aeromonas hydrophila]